MGVQENVMTYWKLLPDSIKFIVLLAVGTGFFGKMASMGMVDNFAIKNDVIASSMSFVNMHSFSEVNLTWDQTNFVMGVLENSILTVISEEEPTISPYPLMIPIKGSEEIDGVHYFVGEHIEEFAFINDDAPEVFTS